MIFPKSNPKSVIVFILILGLLMGIVKALPFFYSGFEYLKASRSNGRSLSLGNLVLDVEYPFYIQKTHGLVSFVFMVNPIFDMRYCGELIFRPIYMSGTNEDLTNCKVETTILGGRSYSVRKCPQSGNVVLEIWDLREIGYNVLIEDRGGNCTSRFRPLIEKAASLSQ